MEQTIVCFLADKFLFFQEPTEVAGEIIETKCELDDQEIYVNLHTQIIRTSIAQKTVTKKKIFRPNVIMMIFDSTSSSNGQRSLAQTMQVLRYKYEATTFMGHNKVGYNSRPNAWALFTGIFLL
jgi:hypothetical protein